MLNLKAQLRKLDEGFNDEEDKIVTIIGHMADRQTDYFLYVSTEGFFGIAEINRFKHQGKGWLDD